MKIYIVYFLFYALVVVVVSTLATTLKWENVQLEEKILTTATALSLSFDSDQLQEIKKQGESLDKDKALEAIRTKLKVFKQAFAEYRFIYLMDVVDGKTIFLADAEEPGTEDYSEPGSLYPEPSNELATIYSHQRIFLEGPVTDKWGVWYSAHAPVFDETTSEMIAIVGIDFKASKWDKIQSQYKDQFYLFGGLIVGLIFLFHYLVVLLKKKDYLSAHENGFNQFLEHANAPIFGIDREGLVNKWNQQTEAITGYSKSEVMGQHLVDSFITEDYREPVQKVLDEALKGTETTSYELQLYTKSGDRVDVLLKRAFKILCQVNLNLQHAV